MILLGEISFISTFFFYFFSYQQKIYACSLINLPILVLGRILKTHKAGTLINGIGGGCLEASHPRQWLNSFPFNLVAI